MNFKAHYERQGSQEWLALRAPFLTASDMGAWLTNGKADKRSTEARQKAIARILATRRGCEFAPTFCSWDMQRGLDLEGAARQAFEEATGFPVSTEVGFCESLEGYFGCSPDGLIEHPETGSFAAGLEIKVLSPHTHVWHLLYDPTIPDEYRIQVHASLAVTGLEVWHFWAWNTGLPPLHVVQKRDAFTEELRRALIQFRREVDEADRKLDALRTRDNLVAAINQADDENEPIC